MTQYPDSETLTAYLLGELSDDDAAALEDAMVSDDALFEHLRAAETDLIDAYAAGALSEHRKAAFEQRLLATPEQRERVAFARALAARVEQSRAAPAPPREGWWQRLTSFVGLRGLAVAGAVAAAVILAVQLTGTRGGNGAEPAAITLQPTRLRAAGAPATLELSRGTDVAVVTLEVDETARAGRYRVALLDEGAGTRTAYDADATDPARVVVTIPVADLGTGPRVLVLTDAAGTELAYYDLVVARRQCW